MMSLEGKRILLVAPKYFGYDRIIAEGLRRAGAAVEELPDRPFDSAFLKAATRFRPELMKRYADVFYLGALEKMSNHFDQILVIQGEALSKEVLSRMRAAFPCARLAFYSWDSLRQKPHAVNKLGCFDACFTFDARDAEAFNLQFRPLFFSPGFKRRQLSDFKYELSFIGTIHADRYSVVRSVDRQLQASDRRFWYLYIQAPWMYWWRRVFTRTVSGAQPSEFRYQPLPQRQVQDIFLSSRAVLDIEHPRQEGLTMRTLEALGSGTKLVTTNAAVREFDFYNPSNICVIDRDRPVLAQDFLHRDYEEVPESIYQRYSLERWIEDICGV